MVYLIDTSQITALPTPRGKAHVQTLSLDEARELAREAESAVDREWLAAIFGEALQRPVSHHRFGVTLQQGDTVLVGQYIGPRLPRGATVLPEGGQIKWRRIDWR